MDLVGSEDGDEPQQQQPRSSASSPVVIPKEVTVNKVKIQTKNIYFNEDLTRTRSELLFKARTGKKSNQISDCWSFDGVIRIKDNENNIHRINNARQLYEFITPN